MKRVTQQLTSRHPNSKQIISSLVASTLLCVGLAPQANAFSIDTGNRDLRVRWDNTLKYSAAFRVKDVDNDVAMRGSNPNTDDGDRNFDKGLISNRVDVLSELDVTFKRDLGFRLSGAAWYDDAYHGSNDNDSPLTNNNLPPLAHNEFDSATEKLHGRKAEILDAFVFGRFSPNDTRLSLRAGQFAHLYGESLFFGANGIAAAQASPDIVKLTSVPSSQFKEILLPAQQVSAQWQLSPDFSVGAYYQLKWEKARLPGVGSYFSFSDFADDGGRRVIHGAPLVAGGPPAAFFRGQDHEASNSGQGGIQFRFKSGDTEYGLYAAQFHDKFPQFYFRPGAGGPADPATGKDGEYSLVYAEDIKTYGASASTLVGEANIAAELSLRQDAPFMATGNVIVDPAGVGNGSDNPLYPVGDSLHLNVSAINVMGASSLWDAASFVGELALNRRLSVSKNAGALDPNTTRDASALRFIFQPEYFQVLPQLDLQLPIGVGLGISGRTSVLPVGAFPVKGGGDVSIGVKANYRQTWQASLTYTSFFGSGGTVIDDAHLLSFDQVHADRDFISLSIQRSF
ncbi:MAG: DUF1302 domain-containing protein [Motiliproteus sp.]